MLTKRIIPCLDVRNGRVVKGVRFSNLRDSGDPVEQASQYELQGADEIVMLDVAATPQGRTTCLDTVRALRNCLSIPLSVGGGIRQAEHALELLRAGADKVAVNTAAVERPQILRELADRVGTQCVVLAIDAAMRSAPNLGWEVVTRSGANRVDLDVVEWSREAEMLGAGEILLTSWDRDGTRLGYDLKLVSVVADAVRLPIIASGGASTCEHMIDAFKAGADAVLAASIFHDDEATVTQVKGALTRYGIEVRQ